MRLFFTASTLLLLAGSALAQLFPAQRALHFGVPGKNASYDYIVLGGGTAGNAIGTSCGAPIHELKTLRSDISQFL